MANKQQNTEPYAVIFDMDGVMIDSNPAIIKTWNSFFNKFEISLTDEQFNQYIFGRTSKDTLRLVFERELSNEEFLVHDELLNTTIAQFYLSESKIVPGITDFVKSLAKNKVPIAIATSSPGKNVKTVLEKANLTGYFDVISDASHALHSKPHPYIYLKTAERLGIDPSRCLVFDDSFSGIASAKAAGMQVIALSTTHTATELAAETFEVISDFTDIDFTHVDNLMNAEVDFSIPTHFHSLPGFLHMQ